MAPDTIIKENNLLDVQDYLVDLDGGLTDENYALVRESNIGDFAEAARLYVSTYSGKVPFIIKLRRTIASKPLTLKQERAALNVMRDELRAGTLERAVTDGRRADHATASAEAAPLAEDEAAVVTSTRTTLDLSPLPDGRYAVYHPGKENGLLFLEVKTLKRPIRRDRRYRYGKRITGSETYPTGTIEVREWSSHSKRLCGFQKPGEGYEGEFSAELVGVMDAPKIWALVFASLVGSCPICQSILTDQASRDRGIGPVCFKKWGNHYWSRWDRKVDALKEVETDQPATA